MVTAGMLFLLYIFVQHHSGIDGCDVWGCKVVTGIFIGHDYLVEMEPFSFVTRPMSCKELRLEPDMERISV